MRPAVHRCGRAGEFDDETIARPAEDEPVDSHYEPLDAATGLAPEPPPAEVNTEPTADVPSEAQYPGSEDVTAEGISSAEPAAAEPTTEEPAAQAPVVEASEATEPALVQVDPDADPIGAIQEQLAIEDLGPDATAVAAPEGGASETSADETADSETAITEDDLAAAVAAANEQVGVQSTLDDIAPGTAHAVPEGEMEPDAATKFGAPWWPFLVYLGLWIVFVGVAVWQFQLIPQGVVVYDTQQYMLFVFAGLVLAGTGILVTLGAWIGARMNPARHRAGLFGSALVKGTTVILIGVVVWWGTILALDYLRLGRLL